MHGPGVAAVAHPRAGDVDHEASEGRQGEGAVFMRDAPVEARAVAAGFGACEWAGGAVVVGVFVLAATSEDPRPL